MSTALSLAGRCQLAATLAVIALGLSACDLQVGDKGVSVGVERGKTSDEWVRSYTVAPGGRFGIENVNGPIEATGTDGVQVEVRAVREANAGTNEEAQALLQTIEMHEDAAPDHVAIRSGRAAAGRSATVGSRAYVTVEYHVRIPRGLIVSLQTQMGGIRMDGLVGTIAAATTNGTISGKNLTGSLNAATVNGGVQIAMRAVTGGINIASVNGSVRLELPAGVKGQLEASAINGTISIDETLPFAPTQTERQRVAGTFNEGGPTISVQTTNGGIRVVAAGARR